MSSSKSLHLRTSLAVAQLAIVATLHGQSLSREKAVTLAERFIRENGYTDAPDSAVVLNLTHESLEWTADRKELLMTRRNTLVANAIGIKANNGGWGVAFDYVDHPGNCRVVIMQHDGSKIRMQHQDGVRTYWVGLEEMHQK